MRLYYFIDRVRGLDGHYRTGTGACPYNYFSKLIFLVSL
jgi:hypothetical protein